MLKAEVKGTTQIMLDHIIVTTNKYLLSIQYKDFLSNMKINIDYNLVMHFINVSLENNINE